MFRFLELVAIFCDFESLCETPPTVKSEHLFSKMKAQAETGAVLQNSLFFRFFFFFRLVYLKRNFSKQPVVGFSLQWV